MGQLRSKESPFHLHLAVAITLIGAAGVLAAVTHDAPSECDRLRSRLAAIEEELDDEASPSFEEVVEVQDATVERTRILRDLDVNGCD